MRGCRAVPTPLGVACLCTHQAHNECILSRREKHPIVGAIRIVRILEEASIAESECSRVKLVLQLQCHRYEIGRYKLSSDRSTVGELPSMHYCSGTPEAWRSSSTIYELQRNLYRIFPKSVVNIEESISVPRSIIYTYRNGRA